MRKRKAPQRKAPGIQDPFYEAAFKYIMFNGCRIGYHPMKLENGQTI